MNYLLLGEAPNQRGQRRGLDAYFLAKAHGMLPLLNRDPWGFVQWLAWRDPAHWKWLWQVKHVNLVDRFPGRSGKGSAFPMRAMRRAADAVLDALYEFEETPTLLFAGKRVAQAFYFGGEYFEEGVVDDDVRCYAIPHPSGVNRWWNRHANRTRARLFVAKLMMGSK